MSTKRTAQQTGERTAQRTGGTSGQKSGQNSPGPEAYAELASTGPYGVRPGHALITMVEPHPGREHEYNRWYIRRTLLTWTYESRTGCDLLGRVTEAIGGSQSKPL